MKLIIKKGRCILNLLRIISKILCDKHLERGEKIDFVRSYFKILKYKEKIESNEIKIKVFGYAISFPPFYPIFGQMREIFMNRVYFFKTERSNPLILDVGSNIGLTVLFFKKFYPDSLVYAFEPDPDNFKYLEKNVKQNKIKNIVLFNYGLSNFEGKTKFYCPKTVTKEYSSSIRGSVFDNTSFISKEETIEKIVEIKKLSNLIKENKMEIIDLLKLDVEGSEWAIMGDISPFLGNISNVFMEYHYDDKMIEENPLSKIIHEFEKKKFFYSIYGSSIEGARKTNEIGTGFYCFKLFFKNPYI